MKTCTWCNNLTNELVNYKGSKICIKCKETAEKSRCRVCGEYYPEELLTRGLCLSCIQVDETERSKKREEVKLGVDEECAELFSRETEMTEADFERWMTYDPSNKGFTPKDFKESVVLRRMWIMTKLNAVGVYEESIINDNIADIEELIESNFSSLIGNKCRFLIVENMKDRRAMQDMECIAYKNKVYIMKVR